jgi:cardiolipin synthase
MSPQQCSCVRLITILLAAVFVSGCASGPRYHYKLDPKYGVADPQFRRTMSSLLGPPLVEGNTVTTLVNGADIFPAMLKAIREARTSINFETYVYWSGAVGATFAEALAERARSGVKVHVLIDAVGGNKMDPVYVETMREAGVELDLFHKLKWFDITSAQKFDHRTHRKLLIVDGKIGFTGGVGIADDWIGHADEADHFRDNHYRIEGPVVAQLQSAFLDEWMEITGGVLHDADYFPILRPVGDTLAQTFKSSPEGGSESMHLMYLLSFNAARKNIRIGASYFVPDELTMQTLLDARQRGVSIQIILPGPHMDVEIVRKASRARWGPLLKAGVEIYEFQPTMYHVKQMVVDDLWVSIGSSNLDNRSFRLNSEANLNVLDAAFAAEQARLFDADLKRSRLVTYEEWKHRPLNERILEGISSLFEPEL